MSVTAAAAVVILAMTGIQIVGAVRDSQTND
jgi:hypothetical protein